MGSGDAAEYRINKNGWLRRPEQKAVGGNLCLKIGNLVHVWTMPNATCPSLVCMKQNNVTALILSIRDTQSRFLEPSKPGGPGWVVIATQV